MGRFRAYLTIVAMSAALLSGIAAAQTTAQTVVPRAGKYEEQSLQLPGIAAKPAASQPTLSFSDSTQLDYGRVVMALGAVIGLIFVMRFVGKKMFPHVAVARNGGSMKVLSRLVVSPKQQILMIQVGKRIVVVGDSSGQMAAVSEITDADEVASLVAQVAEERTQHGFKGFGALFHKAEAGMSAATDGVIDETVEASSPTPVAEDAEVGLARGEISGLMEKVRLLSSQFRRST